jgi:hypothetical protein
MQWWSLTRNLGGPNHIFLMRKQKGAVSLDKINGVLVLDNRLIKEKMIWGRAGNGMVLFQRRSASEYMWIARLLSIKFSLLVLVVSS